MKQRQNLDAQWGLYKAKQQELEVKALSTDCGYGTAELLDPPAGASGWFACGHPDGPWQLELHMPENRMGHLVKAQQTLNDQLQVSYIFATEPGTTHDGTVKEVHRSAEVRGDEGNTVLIKVAIDESNLPHLRPGATVTSQVYCGRRPLGYVLLHDVIAFVQSRILFRYF